MNGSNFNALKQSLASGGKGSGAKAPSAPTGGMFASNALKNSGAKVPPPPGTGLTGSNALKNSLAKGGFGKGSGAFSSGARGSGAGEVSQGGLLKNSMKFDY